MAKVNVEGSGTFEIKNEKLGELLAWLSNNKAVDVTDDNTIREVKDNTFTGRQLINE